MVARTQKKRGQRSGVSILYPCFLAASLDLVLAFVGVLIINLL